MLAVRRLDAGDVTGARALNDLFATAFDDPQSYSSAPPPDRYLRTVLGRADVVALVAQDGAEMVGALVAYVLPKLEQERSEVYLYDLAVAASHRRSGVATALITQLRAIAAEIGAWVVYVQADHGDDPAIALYSKLGQREDVLHFDIPVRATK
ncbi:AAC(3)-I family aminoglycoside N-acetyltransferase [Sphingomonas sp. BN140010]|uniref:AAC(3)-I family aminoglycoside N-acetyltransferase n=1 Tax=Sphingomonas arvum TaxID=2992113 RepID=A0ABT3JE98_9SPHN|nr:AAC(3)-I family aminoglycoside N-acetyltransferase [Sphingomonas sp. BN140010]MCW3797239.1 AAC(3)-I family aminoglycoside N-acetyltransferase [Sphingomonas sp. BN140010]